MGLFLVFLYLSFVGLCPRMCQKLVYVHINTIYPHPMLRENTQNQATQSCASIPRFIEELDDIT